MTSAQQIRPQHCLTFDIEEHFQVSAFASPMRRRHWGKLESRVEQNTEKILAMLAVRELHATFFVLGWVAERVPSLVRRIVAEGHELASHGYGHELITSQTPAVFREDIRKAKTILEAVSGHEVIGYRAPSFSVTKQSLWAIPILVEEGYRYDASIFPVVHDTYGIPGASTEVHQLNSSAGTLLEVPPSTVEVGGVRIPIAGGGYFRFCPYPLFRMFLTRAAQAGHPLVTYFHPWELDPAQPRMEGPILSRIRHYTNLSKTEPRLINLLKDFSFGSIKAVIPAVQSLYTQPRNLHLTSHAASVS
ncbi:MAG: XrtA system polysaccharide deacetylase [Nitrospiraceae bacterium]